MSVAILLGDSEHEDKIETDSIVESLAQINEQLAIKNRRTANFWKASFLIVLVVIGILIGKSFFGNGLLEKDSKIVLPEKIEVSNLSFYLPKIIWFPVRPLYQSTKMEHVRQPLI